MTRYCHHHFQIPLEEQRLTISEQMEHEEHEVFSLPMAHQKCKADDYSQIKSLYE